MSLRHSGPLALGLALLAAGCTKSVSQSASPDEIVLATFSSPTIPIPNDLALQAAPTLPDGAQKLLLQAFIANGGFPSDQEVTVTVPFKTMTRNADGSYAVSTTPPTIDLATVTPTTVTVLKVDGGTVTPVTVEAASGANGVLTLRKAVENGNRRWASGRYVMAVRGGTSGVKTSTGLPVSADQAIALIIPNKDLTLPENQPPGGLPPAVAGQANALRGLLWNPIDWNAVNGLWTPTPSASVTPAFVAVDSAFPHTEVAAIATFEIAPAPGVQPLADTGSGQVPLPSDFLLDGTNPVQGDAGRFHVRNVPAFGPAAAGIATLDGFSTTGMMLQPFNGAVQAGTINANSVLVFELPSAAGTPRRMRDVAGALGAGAPTTAEYLTQPPQLNQTVGGTAVTTTIGLQPGVPVPTPTPAGIVYTPPLKERTRYLVVVTDRIKDTSNNAIKRSTLGTILWGFPADVPVADLTQTPPVSLLSGVSGPDAAALQMLRQGVNPILDNLGALSGDASLTRDNVVMAYTISTQTVTKTSVQLSAAPYASPEASAAFTTTAATVFDPRTLGIPDAAIPMLFPHVQDFLQTTSVSLNAIDPATGALNPNTAAWAPNQVPVLAAVPKVADTCTSAAPCPVPVVIWHHGLNGSRLQMLPAADALAAKGFVVVAADAPYHGARAFCEANHDCSADGTPGGADGVCTPDPAKAGQGDQIPPGTCTTGTLRPNASLSTVASGNYFISANFFRIRDGIRQDLLDQSALVLAVARPPAAAGFPQPASGLGSALLARGITLDPTKVYLEGTSLGGIVGTQMLAANPRFARGSLNVPGGTLTDIFTNAPAFSAEVDALFLSLGIDRSKIATDPAVAARYVQTLIVAKWILDPADPVNYAKYAAAGGLQSPLSALEPLNLSHPQREVFGQLSKCDQVVPNATTIVNGMPLAFGDLLLTLGGVRGSRTTLYDTATSSANPNGCVSHGVLLDSFNVLSGQPVIGTKVRDDAALFLSDLTVPAPLVTLP